jgi:hypothetical protein
MALLAALSVLRFRSLEPMTGADVSGHGQRAKATAGR